MTSALFGPERRWIPAFAGMTGLSQCHSTLTRLIRVGGALRANSSHTFANLLQFADNAPCHERPATLLLQHPTIHNL